MPELQQELYEYNWMTHVIPWQLKWIERLRVIEELIKNQVKELSWGKFSNIADEFRWS